MNKDYYSINMQKLLYVVKELHGRGYEKLRIVPSVSPSGMSWRCLFLSNKTSRCSKVVASGWIHETVKLDKEVELTITALADLFTREHHEFMNECIGKNKKYVVWYSNMLSNLKEGELPYAFADYFPPTDHWKTSKGQEIRTLPSERSYYYNPF
jgi:hypothetical protein